VKPELWKEVERIFVGALDRPAGRREGYAQTECRGNEQILTEVLRLLRAEKPPSEFIEPPSSDEPGPGPELPGRLGEFELLEEIGRGAMGVVYRAIQQPLGRAVAVKVLPPGLALSQQKIDRFVREARAAAKLNHPHIVPVITVGEDQGVRYFAMEYIEGHNLAVELKRIRKALLEEGARPTHLPDSRSLDYFRSVARLVRDVADALQHAHEHEIIHRDIKPSNLQLDSHGGVHVVDFGLAHDAAQSTLTRSGDVAGTPHYMSPEQARAHRHQIDHRTDIYSLGVVLYELLTLKRPYEGKSSAEVINNILQTEATGIRRLNKRVPRDLELICETAMAKDLHGRYLTVAGLRDDLNCFLAHQAPRVARPIPAWRRFQRKCRQHRAALVAVACTVVALIAGAWMMAVLSVPRVHVSITSDADEDRVHVQNIDMVTGRLDDRRLIGTTPLRAHSLDPGYYRFTVERPGFGWSELTRLLIHDGEHYEVATTVRRASAEELDMVFLPAAEVLVGFESDMFRQYDLRKEFVREFWIDKYEVSNGQYRTFLDALSESDRREYEPGNWREEWWRENYSPEWDDFPAVDVLYVGAQAYAEWAGKRLPTYHEWERATRGKDTRLYPWGNEAEGLRTRAVYDREPRHSIWWRDYLLQVAPVNSLETPNGTLDDITEYGLLHALGNAQEWTETIDVSWVDGVPHPGLADRIVKGADWDSNYGGQGLAGVTCQPTALADRVGFRCAKSAMSETE
jgi:serine/threonine protein kinase/formylglycine-generating enzyme required for sulfatase activity